MEQIKEIRVEGFPTDSQSLLYAKEIVAQQGVKGMVVLPDAYTKKKYLHTYIKTTVPSSTAIVSDITHLYPQFRYRGINCGMQVIALPFARAELSDACIQQLIQRIQYNVQYYMGYRLRLPLFPGSYDLSKSEFHTVLERGAPALVEKYQIEKTDVDAMEFGGCLEESSIDEYRQYLSDDWLEKRTVRLRYSFGRYFGGNHFFEIQEVQDVDAASALSTKIKKGQLVVMFHTAGDSIADMLHDTYVQQCFGTDSYHALAADAKARKAFLVGMNMAMNYGYAYRLATFAMVSDAIKKVYGQDHTARMIVDKSHNHIRKERVHNEDVFVYRHNAERIYPGEVGILSGYYDHSSYLVEGGENLEETYFTMDHGIGKILEQSADRRMNTDRHVDVYRAKKGIRIPGALHKRTATHVSHPLVDEYLALMNKKRYIHKVATLDPIMNLKST